MFLRFAPSSIHWHFPRCCVVGLMSMLLGLKPSKIWPGFPSDCFILLPNRLSQVEINEPTRQLTKTTLELRADLQISENFLPNKSSEIFRQTWGRESGSND
jgi:hypothetical protein